MNPKQDILPIPEQLKDIKIWAKELQELDISYQYLVKGLILGLQHTKAEHPVPTTKPA